MIFKAKRDFAYCLMYVINFIFGIALITGLLCIELNFMSILISILLGVEIILISFMFFNCYYVVSNDKIKATIGFVSIDIKIKDINTIKFCQNMIFSFALARNRIELCWGSKTNKKRNKIYVSPSEQQKFIEQIKCNCGRSINENK